MPEPKKDYTTGSARIAVVWKEMLELFGRQWIDSHGDVPSQAWQREISKLPADRVGRGIMKVLGSGSQWPPTLPQFISYCTGRDEMSAEQRVFYGQIKKEGQKQLPHGIRTPSVAKEAIAGLREKLSAMNQTITPPNLVPDTYKCSTDGCFEWIQYGTMCPACEADNRVVNMTQCAICGGPMPNKGKGSRVCESCG